MPIQTLQHPRLTLRETGGMKTSPAPRVIDAAEAIHPVVTPVTLDIGDLLVVGVRGFATPEERCMSALELCHGVSCGFLACVWSVLTDIDGHDRP